MLNKLCYKWTINSLFYKDSIFIDICIKKYFLIVKMKPLLYLKKFYFCVCVLFVLSDNQTKYFV